MDKDLLLKQASDLISDLVTDLENNKTKVSQLEKELYSLRKSNETQKLAQELELKGVVSFDKISSLRNGELDDDEITELKTLSKLDAGYNSNYEITKSASVFEDIQGESATAYNKRMRTEYLLEEMNNF